LQALSVLSLVAVFLLPAPVALAQWRNDGARVSLYGVDKDAPVVCSDTEGGFIVACLSRLGGQPDIRAQRVDGNGFSRWPGDLVVCGAQGWQYQPTICPDAGGGAIVAWFDHRTTPTPEGQGDIYAQRITHDGLTTWANGGVPVCTAPGNQASPVIVGDGAGGAIIAWSDERPPHVYLQHVASDGSTAPGWPVDGLPVCIGTQSASGAPQLLFDTAGGVIVAWTDARGGGSIFAQRVSIESGEYLWNAEGVAVCTVPGYKSSLGIVGDGQGGAILSWTDDRGAGYDVYAQRVTTSGTIPDGWPPSSGVCLCETFDSSLGIHPCESSEFEPSIAAASGGAVVVWTDTRNGSADLFAQFVDFDGQTHWRTGAGGPLDGKPVCTATGSQAYPAVVATDLGDVVAVWQDGRALYDVYAQKMSPSGEREWDPGGVPICTAYGYQGQPAPFPTGDGGAFVVWCDGRDNSQEIYAHRISSGGLVAGVDAGAPARSALDPPRPNPARASLRITFSATIGMDVALFAFDIEGRRVKSLLPPGFRSAGQHAITWTGLDDAGRPLAPGVYFVAPLNFPWALRLS
jgi:hypothetical protein